MLAIESIEENAKPAPIYEFAQVQSVNSCQLIFIDAHTIDDYWVVTRSSFLNDSSPVSNGGRVITTTPISVSTIVITGTIPQFSLRKTNAKRKTKTGELQAMTSASPIVRYCRE